MTTDIKLRPYQIEAIQLLRMGFKSHQRQLLVLPTGSGKSVIFSEMVRRAYEKEKQVLIVTHRIELLTQTLDHISHHKINPQIITAKVKTFTPSAPVTIVMIETFMRRLAKLPPNSYNPNLIIIDEAHRNDFNKIIAAFPNAKIIGATATPNGKQMYRYYTHIVNNIGINELISQGFLSPARSFQMQDDFSEVPVSHGEFVESELYKHFDKRKLYEGIIEEWKEKTPNKKTLVFCVNIDHAVKMNEEFKKAGIHSEVVTSKTPPEERNRIINAYRKNMFPILVNCGILTAGFDDDRIEVIAMNRATMSLSLFLQCCGRGSRPSDNKPFFTILDFGQNFTRHGLWQEERVWKLEPPKEKKKGIAPVRTCPQCDALLPASTLKCPYCGYLFPRITHALKEGVMVEVKSGLPDGISGKKISELSIDEIIKLQKIKRYKAQFLWRIIRSRGGEAISQYAYKMHYKPFWVKRQIDRIKDSNYHNNIVK